MEMRILRDILVNISKLFLSRAGEELKTMVVLESSEYVGAMQDQRFNKSNCGV